MSAAVHEPGDARPAPTAPEIARWLAVLTEAEQLVELRAPRARPDGNTASHFYTSDRLEDLATRALDYSGKVPGVYFTLNPIRPDHPRNRAARDGDVVARRRLLVDCDAVRPGDSSATDAERAAALDVARTIRARLRVLDWPEPALCDSGNGYHLVYGLDLPNDDAGKVLIRACLEALNYQFGTAAVKVDTSVFNASRITKVYGTVAAKGRPTPERPHRHSRLIEAPTCLEYADPAALQALAADAPPKTIPIHGPAPAARPRREVPAGEWSAEDRARAYLGRVEPAIAGQRGHNQAFKAACKVGPGFDLPPDRALALLREWNDTCQPPWNEKELAHKVEEAYKVEARRGWLLESGHPYGGNGENGGTKSSARYGGQKSSSVSSVSSVGVSAEWFDLSVLARRWPDPPGDAAWRGPAGRLARAVETFTEGDPVGILIQTLVGFGNLVGRKVHFRVGATPHYLNEFVCTAGPTAVGRKGTAWDVARMALAYCDAHWADRCIKGGLTSGEGLIWAVRDAIYKKEPIKEKGRVVDYQDVMVDDGVADKRLLALETELGGTLKIVTREGNSLSSLIRQAWDSGTLRSMTKNNPAEATAAHISIIGHITEQEAARYLTDLDMANGFANRFLWVCVKQKRFIPRPRAIDADIFRPILDQIKSAADSSRDELVLERDEAAERLWARAYEPLCQGSPGLLGAILGRGVPHVMRLACIYALLDEHYQVSERHLESALALWDYCRRSAGYIFGEALGDKDADKALDAIRAHRDGLTKQQVHNEVFQKNKSARDIDRILGRLIEFGLIVDRKVATGGRPATVYAAAISPTEKTEDTEKLAAGSEEASSWLRTYLSDRPIRVESAIEDMVRVGFLEPEVRRAAVDIGARIVLDEDGYDAWSVSPA